MHPDVAAKQMTAAYRICVPGMRNVKSTEHGELMSEKRNHPGRLLDMLWHSAALCPDSSLVRLSRSFHASTTFPVHTAAFTAGVPYSLGWCSG
jgi:hypothetical protein